MPSVPYNTCSPAHAHTPSAPSQLRPVASTRPRRQTGPQTALTVLYGFLRLKGSRLPQTGLTAPSDWAHGSSDWAHGFLRLGSRLPQTGLTAPSDWAHGSLRLGSRLPQTALTARSDWTHGSLRLDSRLLYRRRLPPRRLAVSVCRAA